MKSTGDGKGLLSATEVGQDAYKVRMRKKNLFCTYYFPVKNFYPLCILVRLNCTVLKLLPEVSKRRDFMRHVLVVSYLYGIFFVNKEEAMNTISIAVLSCFV